MIICASNNPDIESADKRVHHPMSLMLVSYKHRCRLLIFSEGAQIRKLSTKTTLCNYIVYDTVTNTILQPDELKLQQVLVVVRHGARTPFKFIPNIEQATWPVKDNEDLPHTLINHAVRSLDFGGKPESAIDNAYKDKDKLKVCYYCVLKWKHVSLIMHIGIKTDLKYAFALFQRWKSL